MLKGVLILDNRGDILVDKSQGSGITKADIEILRGSLFSTKKIPPISEFYGTIFLTHRINDVLLIGICNEQSNSAFAAEIMVQLISYIEEYLREPLTESKIKTDFATVYKVIDQFMLEGYPIASDFSSLISILPLPQVSKNRWSFKDKQYVNILCSEVYDAFFDKEGQISLLQIRGTISLDSKLDPKQICEIEYATQPQGFSPIFSDKITANIGQTTILTIIKPSTIQPIMRYTLEYPHLNSLPIFIKPTFLWQKTGIRIEIEAKIGPQKLSSCYISFENPSQCLQPSLAATTGFINYSSESRIVVWELPGEATMCNLSGFLPFDPQKDPEDYHECDIITSVKFRIFGPLTSGFSIKDVRCSNNDDAINKSMKYQTYSGRYEFEPIQTTH